MDSTKARALTAIANALVETVKAAGAQGAPAGIMYAALMDRMTLAQFEQFMTALCSMGAIRQSGNLYQYARPLAASAM